MRQLIVGLVALVLVGCSDSTGVQSARSRWAENQPGAYQFTMQRLCFCLDETTRPVVVTVRGGVVESRVFETTGVAVDTRWASLFPAIDGLFDLIADAEARHAVVTAEYDASRGFPTSMNIDYVVNAIDDELAISVRDFKVR